MDFEIFVGALKKHDPVTRVYLTFQPRVGDLFTLAADPNGIIEEFEVDKVVNRLAPAPEKNGARWSNCFGEIYLKKVP